MGLTHPPFTSSLYKLKNITLKKPKKKRTKADKQTKEKKKEKRRQTEENVIA